MSQSLFDDIKDKVLTMLSDNLSPDLTYHSLSHTLYVLDASLIIAKEEKVSDEDRFLLSIAVLYHDSGFINTYRNHEEESCAIATSQLKEIGFQRADIEKICGMIMATKIPQKPTNLLEMIIADADLEYLGTDKFEQIGNLLYKELKIINPALTIENWNNLQVDFLKNHQYFTSFCKTYREPIKLQNMRKLLI